MKSKQNPATKNISFNSDLSSSNDVDNHLNLLFKAKTGRPAKMKFFDLMYCLELKRKYSCETWLGLYRCLIDKGKDGNGNLNFDLPSYANFLKSIKKLIKYLWFLINYQTSINQDNFLKQNIRIAFVDSTPLSVCKVIHKTMEEFAEYSKSTTGWFCSKLQAGLVPADLWGTVMVLNSI